MDEKLNSSKLNVNGGGQITGALLCKQNGLDATLSNNGLSSGQVYPTTSCIVDKAGRILTRQEAIVYANGNITNYFYARNYNSSGDNIKQAGISVTVNKSGTVSYAVTEPSKFLAAIGVIFERRSATFASIAAGSALEITMNLAKSGYRGVPCYAFTVSRVIVANIYNQDTANGGKVYLINTSNSAVSGTVYVNMIYLAST